MMHMPKQFWNREKTDASLKTLRVIAEKIDFVLVGGWAVYMYTGMQKSEDVDIAISYDSLDFFRKYGINDYGGIKIKYSVVDGTTVGLFIEAYSDVSLPVHVREIIEHYVLIDNIKVVKKELLLLLKLWVYFRESELKVDKDIIDVISLLNSGVDMQEFKAITEKHKIESRMSSDALLEYLDKGRHLWDYVADSEKEYTELVKKYRKEIKHVFY